MNEPRSLATLLALALAPALAACGSSSSSSSSSTAAAVNCDKASLATLTKGQLTIGTDKPAYPPYFVDDKPENGKGFESAVAYAIAKQLGFSEAEVKWTVVPFDSSYAPGPKKFDFDVNQISITPARQKVVSFSTPYYTAPQAVVVQKAGKFAAAKSLADLKDASIGVQVGTTSLKAVQDSIKPNGQPKVFNNSDDVVTALKNKQVDAVVVDLPTAFYLTAAQVPSAVIAGQFSVPGGDTWGALMQKSSPIAACVNQAVGKLKDSGELKRITDEWMGAAAGAPQLS